MDAQTTSAPRRRGRPPAIKVEKEARVIESKTPTNTDASTTAKRKRVTKAAVPSPKAKNSSPIEKENTKTKKSRTGKTKATTPKSQVEVIEEHRLKVSASENKTRKILTRVKFAILMIAGFIGFIYTGHLAVLSLVLLVQIGIYRELLKVRYVEAKDREIPFFRTTQWIFFCLACFHCYGAFIQEKGLRLPLLSTLFGKNKKDFEQFHDWVTNSAFAVVFVLTVLQISRRGHYRYQVNNLTWTLVTLGISVYQLKYTWEIIYEGLFWFVFPASCIVVNDIMAYFSGMLCGRKFIKTEFLTISPNKTWEGFIGAFLFTMIFAYFFSEFLWKLNYLTSPKEDISPIFQWNEDWKGRPEKLEPPKWANFISNVQLLQQILETIRNYTPLKSVWENPETLYKFLDATSERISEKIRQYIEPTPIQLHALALGLFASLVAPFGGFLMSAIKRAFNLKDFDSVIPGHGGLTDRCDCQLIMLWFVKVYYNFFIKKYGEQNTSQEQCANFTEPILRQCMNSVLEDFCKNVVCNAVPVSANEIELPNSIITNDTLSHI